MNAWLKKEWTQLISFYTEDQAIISNYWNNIEGFYSSRGRHYHNLEHIYRLLLQAEDLKGDIADYDAFRFAIWYHDIIYKASKSNNEAKSAEFAKNRLKATKFDGNRIEIVQKLIKSTKKHEVILTENSDNALILDIDLSILGSDWETYNTYIQNIRKEYVIYSDFIYKSGRKKVLQEFLQQEQIFLTELYVEHFEAQARFNIEKEMAML